MMDEMIAGKKGYHAELVSLYIPADRPISMAVNFLQNELSSCSSIKSKTTRKHVMNAITALIKEVQNSAPSVTGHVFFAGYVPQGKPGTEKFEGHHVIPDEPVEVFRFQISNEFLVDACRKTCLESHPVLPTKRGDMAKCECGKLLTGFKNKEGEFYWAHTHANHECDFCGMPFFWGPTTHVNVCQDPTTHVFCSVDCRDSWCHAIARDERD